MSLDDKDFEFRLANAQHDAWCHQRERDLLKLAGMAMQGMLSNGQLYNQLIELTDDPEDVVETLTAGAITHALALLSELDKRKQ